MRRVRRVLRILLSGLMVTTTAAAQDGVSTGGVAAAAPMPRDSAVRVGTLSNGVTYYLRGHPHPKGKAELRLAVRAGSLLEDDDQRGLAHAVEHMAFVGTRRFSRDDLYEYLQRLGVSIGPDVNAATSWGSTVYQLGVPTDTAALLTRGIQVLADWAHGITFDSVGMEHERRRLLDEWQYQQWNTAWRADLLRPVLYGGTRYAERRSSGTKASLETFTREQLQRFYRDWYRPELMAVVAVGDFDVRAMERLIQEHFGRIPQPRDARPRPVYNVALGDSVRVAIATDSNLVAPRVSVSWLRTFEHAGPHTVEDYRGSLLTELYVELLNDRLADLVFRPEPPFLAAAASTGPVAPFADLAYYHPPLRLNTAPAVDGASAAAMRHVTLGVDVPDTGVARGFASAVAEVRRVTSEGFDSTAWARVHRASVRQADRLAMARDTASSSRFAELAVNHFLHAHPLASPAQLAALRKELLADVTLADVQRAGQTWLAAKDRLVVVTVPPRPGIVVPSGDSLIALLEELELSAHGTPR